MYVCICKAVTDSEICRAVAGGAVTIEELQSCLPLGSGCGKCLDQAAALLQEQLDDKREPKPSDANRRVNAGPVLNLTSFA